MKPVFFQRRLGFFARAATLACAFLTPQAQAAYNQSLTQRVATAGSTYSYIQGQADPGNSAAQRFLGVPFAAPPVGAMRWRAPADPPAWSGVRDASRFASQCAQVASMFDPAPDPSKFGTVTGSEDCLYLNVYRPNTTQDNLPVFYWVYGGSNLYGGANDPIYEGANFAVTNNVIVVTVNYRLGMLGFLYEPALHGGSSALDDSGNFATLDLVKGLKWVSDNITTFGGNRNNVTIAGQSAGCINTWGLIQTPLAAGKFQKAICMSGIPNMYPPAYGQGFAGQMETRLLMGRNPGMTFQQADSMRQAMSKAQLAALLRSASAAEIMLNTPQPVNPGHFMDGTVIPTSLGVPGILSCNYNKVPMIIGNVKGEGSLFVGLGGGWQVSEKTMWSMMNYNTPVPSDPAVIAPAWMPATGQPFSSSPYARTSRTLTDLLVFSSDQVIRYLQAQALCFPQAVYRYQFGWENQPQPWLDVYGPEHALDVPFVFRNYSKPSFLAYAWTAANQTDRQDLSNMMNYYLGNFLWNGDPNNSFNNPQAYRGAPYWNRWTNFVGLNKRLKMNASLGQANAAWASYMSSDEELAAFTDILTLPPVGYSFSSSFLKGFIPQQWLSAWRMSIP